MFVKAPAKVIISGEHSVVYGHKAICAAINKFTTLRISESSQMEIRWGSVYREIYNPQQKDSSIAKILRILPMPPHLIEVESEVPLSSGLGSSASFAVALTKAFKGNLQQAIEIENVFHGKRGSGLDVQVCNKGGVCVFQIGQQIEQIDLRLNKFLLIDSGERKQGTQASIQKVKNCVENGDGKNIINRISEVTQQIIKEGIVKELIYENHDLLDRLGICTNTINQIINICKKQRIPAKMTGAGDGGFCVAFPKNEQEETTLKQALSSFKIINAEVDLHTTDII